MQMHLALTTTQFEKSVEFYTDLLGVPPAKQRDGYATFRPDDLALRLSIMEGAAPKLAPGEHFGVHISDPEVLQRAWTRMQSKGYLSTEEQGVACCMAQQDKLWLTDPDGRPWEIYIVLEDTLDADQQRTDVCCVGNAPVAGCCP
ncbi:MAG: ArsI/CadI family heavy metal resistance metalloenzyme [Bradymonadia bacterium]